MQCGAPPLAISVRKAEEHKQRLTHGRARSADGAENRKGGVILVGQKVGERAEDRAEKK